jgi:CubicO group peptidase (beta-lactamase class C family)
LKQFTALAVMMLAERGSVGYDDPITRFCRSWLPAPGDGEAPAQPHLRP